MIEYFFSSVSLLTLSILLLFLTYFAWKIARKIFDVSILIDLIFFFVFSKLILYYLLPTLMRIGSNYQFEREDNVTVFSLVLVYSIEFISWFVWYIVLIGILFIITKRNKKKSVKEFIDFNFRESKILIFIIAIGFIIGSILTITNTDPPLLFDIIKQLFFYAGLSSGPLLMVLSLKYYGKLFFILGTFATLLALLYIPTRGALVYTFLFILFLVIFVLKSRKGKIIFCGLTAGLVALYFVFGGLFKGTIYIDNNGNVLIDAGVSADKKGDKSTIEEIEWRFGAQTRMGTVFLKLYNKGESAGFNPIKHSLMGFMPRSLSPDKPIPSTLDGDDIYSQGMYIVSREINGYNTFSMVEFPTGAHFYWEFGFIGVIILSAISGLYVALCTHFFSKIGIIAIPLIIAIFKPWGYVEPKIWVSDIAMQIYQIILPLIFLVYFFRASCKLFFLLKLRHEKK